MTDSGDSDVFSMDCLSEDDTVSLQLGQDEPVEMFEAAEERQIAASDDDEAESVEEVDEVELRSRFNATADKALLVEVLATPPFTVERKMVTAMWKGVSKRLNQSLSTNFNFRSCRDRTGLLLRQYAVRKGCNEAASGTSEVYTDNDDVLQQLKTEAAIQKQVSKKNAAMKTQEIETAGQRLMQAAEKRVSARLIGGGQKKPQKRRRLSTLLQNEQEEAVERRKLEEQKVNLHREELQLRREEFDHQRRQHEFIREKMQHQAAQTKSLLKLVSAAINQTKPKPYVY
ncbi:hypothetical protein F443_03388 [Phytophthora nicotianae P1569]|uniref:Uncharacterized protein n=1 Tax=Phytophthora nicotianae P1569 TaxID=1317065 RepID=V9FQI1_PHYNI|nr:hypothetical protein F443_03388 [Phytophthora nicotianae P1569]